MAVTQILALFAATVSAEPSQPNRSLAAQLGVTATVVRPAEVVTVPAAGGEIVAVVRNAESVEVLASPGTVVPIAQESVAVTSGGADRLVLTLVY